MPRGSKPGERRGGRQRGTPNKSTVLKNAAIAAAASDPNLSPLDFLLKLMRQRDLPVEYRVSVAHQALPFAHAKPKALRPPKHAYGDSQTGVNGGPGPRVKIVRVNTDPADLDSITPLDFLLGVMRDAKSPAGLRLRVARMVAPYIHTKGEPRRQDEARPEMMVVDDPYGFNPEMLESLHRDVERLRALEPPQVESFSPEKSAEYGAALEKVKQTPAYLELEKSIADKFPSNYNELDSRQDHARLRELEAESKTRPLTAAEETEQKHLQARRALYAQTRQAADCYRMDFFKAVRADLLFPEEKEELQRLEARYPEVPCDPTRFERWQILSFEAFRPIERRVRERAQKERRDACKGFPGRKL